MPASAPYSTEAVRKRKAEDEARQDAAAVQKMSLGRIRRADVLRSALLGGGLERECEGRLGARTGGRRTYVERWADRTVLEPTPQGQGVGRMGSGRVMPLSAFDVDMDTGTMVFGGFWEFRYTDTCFESRVDERLRGARAGLTRASLRRRDAVERRGRSRCEGGRAGLWRACRDGAVARVWQAEVSG